MFRAKRADRVKLIFWDGTGVCLFAKRLEGGAFRWPNLQDGVMHLTAAQLSALLEGLDWRRVHAVRQQAHRSAEVCARSPWLLGFYARSQPAENVGRGRTGGGRCAEIQGSLGAASHPAKGCRSRRSTDPPCASNSPEPPSGGKATNPWVTLRESKIVLYFELKSTLRPLKRALSANGKN